MRPETHQKIAGRNPRTANARVTTSKQGGGRGRTQTDGQKQTIRISAEMSLITN